MTPEESVALDREIITRVLGLTIVTDPDWESEALFAWDWRGDGSLSVDNLPDWDGYADPFSPSTDSRAAYTVQQFLRREWDEQKLPCAWNSRSTQAGCCEPDVVAAWGASGWVEREWAQTRLSEVLDEALRIAN